ncbi:hypothetical protein BDR04DRAFT_1116584 [Suillus decipiens]|nr:hypothetical protein BDR04DRAFT_1116584 [Suillus decipiens]
MVNRRFQLGNARISSPLPRMIQANLTLKVPHLFNAANLEVVHGFPAGSKVGNAVAGNFIASSSSSSGSGNTGTRGYFPEYKVLMLQLVLKEACLSFYYGNGKKVLKVTDIFQDRILVNGLILVTVVMKGVLSGFNDSGTDKVPDLTADMCRADFNLLQKSVDKLMTIPKCCVELEEMLKEWAEEGMMGELCNDLDSAVGSDDINIII